MKLTNESKFFAGIVFGTLIIIVAAVMLLSQPAKPVDKEKLITSSTHTIGNNDAKVWLVEFSDFECPACKLFSKTIETLITDHKETLLFAHRHYPLPQHLFAVKAAIAAESAGRQGKFWEMWKLLYDEPQLSASTVSAMVKTLNLDEQQFASDSNDPTIAGLIEEDQAFGESLGITATPTFYLNGVKLDVRTPAELKIKVEEAIKQ
jgi:protein-disulfide isomerase